MKNNTIRHLINGKPSVIISKGKVNFEEMKRLKYNLDDLTNDFKKFKADNYKRVFDYLKLAPIDVRKHSAILAACCLSCDREVTASETEDFKKLLVLLGLSV